MPPDASMQCAVDEDVRRVEVGRVQKDAVSLRLDGSRALRELALERSVWRRIDVSALALFAYDYNIRLWSISASSSGSIGTRAMPARASTGMA